MGDGANSHRYTPVTVNLPAGRTPVAVDNGYHHNCALLDNGEVWCWGYNAWGQLGIGDNSNRNTPQKANLPAGRTAVDVEAAGHTTCAILDNGELWCPSKKILHTLKPLHDTTLA